MQAHEHEEKAENCIKAAANVLVEDDKLDASSQLPYTDRVFLSANIYCAEAEVNAQLAVAKQLGLLLEEIHNTGNRIAREIS